ncbi:MAG: saccharopine dehydrogenase NADP-binding domain-containing protein [Bacteroidales bacterium]|jgi:saccharopine dehydrogenase-like NADP-dependent oxidoreductase|nr:saccharopine dehydrogenase NADP-binding domain-containing protein [Bacteroidales bacterium]
MKVIVLGAGLVGGPMAIDLSKDPNFEVTLVDVNRETLSRVANGYSMAVVEKDLNDPDGVRQLVSEYDMVVNAVPGFMGFQTLRAIIEAGKNAVDIAFFIEDPFQLDELAKKMNITAIMDIGVAPGMCNVLIGFADHQLDETEKVLYYVGGLPQVREWPWEYKAVFSPIDVIEEYTRPARYIENGKMIVKPALSDPELLNFPGIGTLEAFNTDGLRSLALTMNCPNMKEKTLRYPGHIEKMRVLREMGLFEYDAIEVKGKKIRPIDFTSQLLFPKWKLNEGEVDITVMQVIVEGVKAGKRMRYIWDLFDKYDPESGIHSMARTTGYTATVALRMIAAGHYTRKGITVPEYIGKEPACVEYLLKGLKERGVIYSPKIELL